MKRRTRSILEEITDFYPPGDKEKVIESRAKNIIESSINLINLINETYSKDIAKDLNNRFLNSIRGQDSKKFSRGIKRVIESK